MPSLFCRPTTVLLVIHRTALRRLSCSHQRSRNLIASKSNHKKIRASKPESKSKFKSTKTQCPAVVCEERLSDSEPSEEIDVGAERVGVVQAGATASRIALVKENEAGGGWRDNLTQDEYEVRGREESAAASTTGVDIEVSHIFIFV